jgi:antitoxin VapB
MADVAKVFMSGRSQAGRLPKPYRFDCEEVEITRQGDAVVLRPRRANPWANVEAALAEFDAAAPFGFDREQLPPQERPELDALFE